MLAAEDVFEHKLKEYYKSILEQLIGFGWYDACVSALHEGVDLSTSESFDGSRSHGTVPLPQSSVPVQHPRHDICRMQHNATVNSIVQIFS
jgi:hypothetical protein